MRIITWEDFIAGTSDDDLDRREARLQDSFPGIASGSGYAARLTVLAVCPAAIAVDRADGSPEPWQVMPDPSCYFPPATTEPLAWKLAAVFLGAYDLGGIPTRGTVEAPRRYLQWSEYFQSGCDVALFADQALLNIAIVTRARLLQRIPAAIKAAKANAKLTKGGQGTMFSLFGGLG